MPGWGQVDDSGTGFGGEHPVLVIVGGANATDIASQVPIDFGRFVGGEVERDQDVLGNSVFSGDGAEIIAGLDFIRDSVGRDVIMGKRIRWTLFDRHQVPPETNWGEGSGTQGGGDYTPDRSDLKGTDFRWSNLVNWL